MTRCFCWMRLCNSQTGGYCKKKISKGTDRDPQRNAKHVQFVSQMVMTSHDLTANDSGGSGNLFQMNKNLAK